jgi:hypothetical protein
MRAELAEIQAYIAVRSSVLSGQISDELNESARWIEVSHGEDVKKKETIDDIA